ncbi:hypothetical protein M409DRAFT_52992 [Zasmidium cellare ATCC 36951]|uniref:ARM repeat-containing protein n=1 Tax=Zasmidium cellare ATCC 36951 TaxID=1080233 RepID=A0A6A6CS92_ZASCE|nr:uncharacterized protein M409DRAFT_52992 [Zasmidium cellare ATCC 36951]KAF2169020.1 hypothetical protein M409DRAFT_52992 [Zasmidium cellare ATCC 36951]
MSAPAQSPEQRELALVGKVEMRIALADTDAKFESILKTYLAPLLLKLASEFQSVRQKVISVCQHVNTRIQPQSIQPPVAALVKQFREQESSLIRHFDMLYIQQGVVRLPAKERAELLPIVVQGAEKGGSQASQVFYLLLRLLESFTLPPRGSKEDLEMRTKFEVADADVQYLAKWLGKFILFAPQKGTSKTCPGLNTEEYTFFTVQGKDDAWNPNAGGLNLLRTKTLAARLLASGLFNDHERFLPAVFCSADPASSISDVGDDMMKRALPATQPELEKEDLPRTLFDLYFGVDGAPGVRAPLKLKILWLLEKSKSSTTFANNIIKLVNDGVSPPQQDGEDTVMSNGIAPSTNIGREATKLRSAIFSYINFAARTGEKDDLHAIASQVVWRLRDFIENQGWPRPGINEDLISRAYAYEVIGLLVKAGPKSLLVEEEATTMDLLRWLFKSLASDSSGNSITVSIEESLSTILAAMTRIQLNRPEQDVLESLLIDQMTQSADLEANGRLRSTRYVAVRFANRCLPYASVKARWIDVLAVGASTDRQEVREEGERGLSPYWYRMLNATNVGAEEVELTYPTFEEVIDQFFVKQAPMTGSDRMALTRRVQEAHETSFPHITAYARRMLVHQALKAADVPVNLDSEWERRLDTMVESDVPAKQAVKAHIKATQEHSPALMDTLVSSLFACLTSKSTLEDNRLVEFLSLGPNALIQQHVTQVPTLVATLKSNNHIRRMAAAQAFGILASHQKSDSAASISQLVGIAQSWSTALGAVLSSVHGAVVALGFYFSRWLYRHESSPSTTEYQQFLKTLFEIFADARDDLLREASHVAIGQMSMFGCLSVESIDEFSKMRTVTDRLYEKAKDGNEIATLALGQLSMLLPEDDEELQHISDQLHKLHEIRQAEVHFTVGEAFSYVASGWKSDALATKLDVNIEADWPSSQLRSTTLNKLIEQTLKDCANTKPSLKKAAVMWLLCLVQFCGENLQDKLAACQNAFRRCLSDRDELVQETASRGLGLVYEKGDRNLKDDLVRQLITSFSSDKQSQLAGNVSEDTQLFEPGALPTGDGSVSTYKDIMSLASEVGDSSLVYKFMSMASSNAIWSSRAAFGRFGLSRVLSDSSVDGYLANNPKLYPKLFRYRFDPNSGVQRSMNDIWSALVSDSSATIDKYFDAIMQDLLESILGREWRVRQACCAAIADLVQGRPLEKYEQYLEQIWTQCFRVLDDIKESVRASAASLARTLTGVLTRSLEADHTSTKNASAMLKHVLPFLLSPSGMESSAKEIQMFSITTLLEIIKKANGATIRPFIPELVERLIGSLSDLEPEAVNYIHMNAAKYDLTEQKIDDMRLSSVRMSPLMEAIERCLDLLDDDTMKALWPRLENAMKSAIGLPSKVGASRVLVSLSTRQMVLFRPYSDDALKLIERVVIDRNETVSSSYAVAAGYLARGASDKQILRLIAFAKKLYFESEGDREAVTPRRSITSGDILLAFSKNASDKFNSFASAVLPFVFVAKHDSHDQVKEPFQDTWSEAVAGSRAVQLYLSEILELCMTHLDSPQWALKHTAARAVADAAVAVSSSEAQMSSATGAALWPAIEKALGGKTWEGKENVLSGFVKFVETGKPYYMEHDSVRSAINKIAIREAKHQNAPYRQHSMKALARIARTRTDSDMSDAIFEAVAPVLSDESDEDKMDVDGGNKDQIRKAEDIKDATIAAAIEAVFASINPAAMQSDSLQRQSSRAIHVVASSKPATQAGLRSAYKGLASMAKRIEEEKRHVELDPESIQGLKSLLFGPVVGIEAIRLTRADALVALTKMSPSLSTQVEGDIRALISSEVSSAVRDRLAAAVRAS